MTALASKTDLKSVLLQHLPIRVSLLAVLAAAGLVALAGCRAIDFYDQSLELPPQPNMVPPRELDKISLPAYQIEPPDILQIEMLKMVPLPPYRTEIYDVLQIRVLNTLLDQPIDGFYMIEGEGNVDLGPAYGKVRVAGMTIEEVRAVIGEQLGQILREPEVSVQLARTAGTQPVTGQYLVGPDGTVNLRRYGAVHVAGKTLTEAKIALEKHLSEFFDSPEVTVDVAGYNSKVYYVITEAAGLGDNITRVSITGNETVLDAISQIGGLSQLSSKEIWIARPAPGGFGCEQILPVDWDAITRGAATGTNYQIMPGDRVFIAEDGMVALRNVVARVTGPIEQIAGLLSLGTSTIRGFQRLGRSASRYGGY